MQVTAKLNHFRMSPRKVRLVADIIRGRKVEDAQNQLQFINKRAARPLLKLLNSAVANAENNFKLAKNNLYIAELRVDEGATLKRWLPRAMGRATPINKRTSHISMILDEKEKTQAITDKEHKEQTKKGKEEKKIDKDVKIVNSLDEIKELDRVEEVKSELNKEKSDGVKEEIKNVRSEGSDRQKQHLDKIRRKSKGGILKRVFRRKSI